MPGAKKTFVDVDGNFYPCEKVSENEAMIIGSLSSGYDYGKIRQQLNIGTLTENECKDCWAFNYCMSCISMSSDENGPSRSARLASCHSTRSTLYAKFECMALLMHFNCNFEEQ